MGSYLVEPALTALEMVWIDQQIAKGRFASRTAAVLGLMGRGLESENMAASSINDPDHWRQRAEEMRALAAEVGDQERKAAMLRLAADYDKLAQRAAERTAGPFPKRQG